jgi:hypothetical protein
MGREIFIPLTLDEHRELGREMRATTLRLRSFCDLVVQVYGPNNLAAFAFLKTLESLDRVNFELQAQARQDLPGHEKDNFYE